MRIGDLRHIKGNKGSKENSNTKITQSKFCVFENPSYLVGVLIVIIKVQIKCLLYVLISTTVTVDSLFQARAIVQVTSPEYAQGDSSKSLAL